MVLDAKSGIQAPTEIILEQLQEHTRPMIMVLNKMDLENIEFLRTVDEIKDTYGLNLVPITMPGNTGEDFSKVIDILQNQGYDYKDGDFKGSKTDTSDSLKDQVEEAHNALVESIVETDDELLNKYLEGEKIDEGLLSGILKKAVVSGEVIPVFAVSASKNFGVDILMDYINNLLPSPMDTPPIKAKVKDEETEIEPSADGPVLAYVFKTMADPYIGKLSIFRIFSGTLKAGSSFMTTSSSKALKFSNMFKLQGKQQIETSSATCGEIVAVSKLMEIENDDTIYSNGDEISIEKVAYMQPTLPKAVMPKSKGDEEKIGNGLSKLVQEDQTLKQELNLEVHQNILWGMGDLHLSITRDKLKEKYDVEIDMATPQVAYKETIKKASKAEYKYKKQSGGRGQFGHVFIDLKPLKGGEDFEFTDSIFGGAIPKGYIPGVEKGIKEALEAGVLAKFPVIGVGVNLYDGSFHTVDSSEMAFKIAASMAFKKGMQDAGPIVLEPIMQLDIVVPDKYMGDIIGDINSKRGKIISMTPAENKKQLIKASVPQAEAFNYAVDLTSLTQGRGRFSQEFLKYEELPYNLTEKLIEERKEKEE
jgi:elongation factor G